MPSTEPSPPRVPKSLTASRHETLETEDEWVDEHITGADVSGLEAEHVSIARSELREVQLIGARLHRCALTDVRFVDCDLSGAFLIESEWLRVELRNCRMSGLVVSQSRLRHVGFHEAKLDGGDFRLTNEEQVAFVDCVMPDSDFYEAALTRVTFQRCDLRAAHFVGVRANDIRLHGSKVEGVRGVSSLRGSRISVEQVLPLALGLFSEVGITIDAEGDTHRSSGEAGTTEVSYDPASGTEG